MYVNQCFVGSSSNSVVHVVLANVLAKPQRCDCFYDRKEWPMKLRQVKTWLVLLNLVSQNLIDCLFEYRLVFCSTD